MPGEFGAGDALLVFCQIHLKTMWEQRRGETDSQLRTFSPRFFFPCCSITFESHNERESNYGVDRVVENVNEKVSRAFID